MYVLGEVDVIHFFFKNAYVNEETLPIICIHFFKFIK